MTQERFLRLLDNPDLLATIPYEEMKTLALAYPYTHNLRYLLALKARQDNHPDADRMLSVAAVYSLDREHLFLLTLPKIKVFQPVSIVVEEAVLELKPIEIVQRELESLAPQIHTEKKEKPVVQEIVTPAPAAEDLSKPRRDEIFEPEKSLQLQPFTVWMSHFNPPVLDPKSVKISETSQSATEEKPLPGLSAQELAERSVAENKDVISETLARLLAKQGYRDKAAEMYERLRLAFPDKSAYFAAEIEKLKK